MDFKYILEARDVTYVYGSRNGGNASLKNVSLGIREGVRTVILGANGAGKSTLFYHFNGVFKPTEGELFYRGIPMSYQKEHLFELREDVAVVVQNPDEQIFSSTVEEDVAFGPMNLNLHPDIVEARIRDSLFKVGMEDYRYRPTTQLSFGQKKRVAIAGALAMEPKVLILDEPTAGLDPQMSQEVMELVDQMCLAGTTVIISTHDVDLAYAWAEEIHVLRHGTLVYSGEPEQFFNDRDSVALAGLTLPHTFSVNRSLEAIRGQPEAPYPRTNSQLQPAPGEALPAGGGVRQPPRQVPSGVWGPGQGGRGSARGSLRFQDQEGVQGEGPQGRHILQRRGGVLPQRHAGQRHRALLRSGTGGRRQAQGVRALQVRTRAGGGPMTSENITATPETTATP